MNASFNEEFVDFLNHPDPRVAKWPMMESPTKTIALMMAYLTFIKVIGPRWMQNKKPFELRQVMIVYNFAQVAMSTWCFMNLGIFGWFTKYSWKCEPMDLSYNRQSVIVAEACWLCFMNKFVDWLDTVFFVLRKKDSQITSFHVFHHFIAPFYGWIGVKYGATGYNSLLPFLNSFVHMWMYLYYGLAALGPSIQKYLWWKKYLTILQMVQFVLLIAYDIKVYISPDCEASKFLLFMNAFNGLLFLLMFQNFYKSTYKRKVK